MKLRIKFSKHGVLKYIGHLDLMRYFQKAFRRTDINVLYSKGFSPHMIMSFAQPLGVGVESDGEYFDVEVEDFEDVTTISQRLNDQMAEGIIIQETVVIPDNATNAMASVAAAKYELSFYKESPITKELINKYNSTKAVTYTKTTKSGEHIINVKDYVFDVNIVDSNTLYICVDASSGGNLKPISFMEAILSLDNKVVTDYPFHILRKDTLKKNKNNILVPLNNFENE